MYGETRKHEGMRRAYWYVAMTEDAAQRSRWTFREVVSFNPECAVVSVAACPARGLKVNQRVIYYTIKLNYLLQRAFCCSFLSPLTISAVHSDYKSSSDNRKSELFNPEFAVAIYYGL